MIEVTKRFTFEASHHLPWHSGKCRNLHGHSYKLEVSLSGDLNDNGIVVDFYLLSALVQQAVIDRYDHQNLNQFFDNPTAENIATNIFLELSALVKKAKWGADVRSVKLWETEKCHVTISK